MRSWLFGPGPLEAMVDTFAKGQMQEALWAGEDLGPEESAARGLKRHAARDLT